MEQVDYEHVRRVLYNLLDVGAKTFLDSLIGRVQCWTRLKQEFIARNDATSTDAKHMLYQCVQFNHELAVSYFGRVEEFIFFYFLAG